MAQKFLTNLDLNQNQLINATFEKLGTDPTTGNFDGRLIFNSTEGVIKVYDSGLPGWRRHVMTVTSAGSHATGLTISEENGAITITPNLATSASAGLMSASDFSKLADAASEATASKLVIRDGSSQAKFGTPTDAAHVATKGYVDAARQGLDVKQSVKVATVGAINISTDLDAGSVIDGVTLVAGDRVLVKDQSTATENGIYVAVASGAASRSSDANGTADTGELKSGTFTFVEEGTTNSDKGFVLSTNGTITVGSSAIAWTQFSGAGSFTAGDGISQSGNTINVNVVAGRTEITSDAVDIASTYVGQSSITTLGTITTGVWNGTDVAVADGGTGSSTQSGARTNLASASAEATGRTTSTPALARVASQGCAASAAGVSSTTVTHNFNTLDVSVQIVEVAGGATVIGDVVRANADTVTVTLYGTIGLGDYRIVVTG